MSSCEPVDDTESYKEKIVVFGNLRANEGLSDTIFVSRTYDIGQPHEAEANWISDADVSIKGHVFTHPFKPIKNSPGRYIKKYVGEKTLPNIKYELSVKWEGQTLTSETIIPDTLHIRSVLSSDYQCDGKPVTVFPINLYLDENTKSDIRQAINTGDFSKVKMDTVVYKEGSCYTTSFASIPMFVVKWDAESNPGMMRLVSYALQDDAGNAIVDTTLSAHIFKGHMMVNGEGQYYWANPIVWHLSQEYLDFGWLSFNYTGVHLVEVQVADESFRKYYKGFPLGPPQNQYILPESNIDGGYGLFSSTYSKYFLVYVKTEEK